MSFIKRLFSSEAQAVAAVKPSKPEEIQTMGPKWLKAKTSTHSHG
jgi:hypothetical protein